MTDLRRIEDLDHAELAVLVREYLLGGHLVDRAGMPHVIAKFGREVMGDIAIDEWMGASPIYTRRMQRLLGFEGDSVETIFKGMQFDIGAPPEFLDFRYRVIDHDHGEFWLDHCGALMDVEPMGDDFVHTMCHTIEDPTFDATACATNPRARMTPVHRPPRVPADRQPHCHWKVDIVHDAEPLSEPEPAQRLARTLLAQLPLPDLPFPTTPGSVPQMTTETASSAERNGGGGSTEEPRTAGLFDDYRAPIDPDLRTEQFSRAALLAMAEEIGLQWHLLSTSFLLAVERRSTVEDAVAIGARQFAGIAGLSAERLHRALGLGTELVDVAQVLELHPAFRPRSYVDWRVELATDGGEPQLLVHLGDGPALHEQGLESWMSILGDGHAEALDAIVHAVDPRAHCVQVAAAPGAVASWQVVLGAEPRPESDDVALTRFSKGADFEFTETPVRLA